MSKGWMGMLRTFKCSQISVHIGSPESRTNISSGRPPAPSHTCLPRYQQLPRSEKELNASWSGIMTLSILDFIVEGCLIFHQELTVQTKRNPGSTLEKREIGPLKNCGFTVPTSKGRKCFLSCYSLVVGCACSALGTPVRQSPTRSVSQQS